MLDFTKAMKSIPGAFQVEALDADGKTHKGVIVGASIDRNATQFGITTRGTDTLYVGNGFAVPKGNRVSINLTETKSETRRIEDVSACPYFLAINLGEVC